MTTTAPRLIALPAVTAITTLRKTALYQLIKDGELRPVKIGRKTLFAESEIFEWVNARLASRDVESYLEAQARTSTSQAGV